ncbi:MAG: hypothetical protein HYT42_01160 [Candidatus Sungbacteria bacterium]|nr:hypothetical protein [Candidatus Sungbacteria bacterium]
MRQILIIAGLFLGGCAGFRSTEGAKATLKEPLHAPAGVAVTIWKIPIAGVGLWGLLGSDPPPPLEIHQYNYQAAPPQPQAGVPIQPPSPPQPVPYQTVYPASPFNDPTLVIFTNASDRATFEVSIDGGAAIVLAPRTVSANINLDVGDHTVRVRGTIPTHFGPRPVPEYTRVIRVEARGGYQSIVLSE